MFARLFQPAQEERAITLQNMWGPWYGEYTTSSGLNVNRLSALQLLAVFGSVQLIVNEVSTLPVDSTASWVEHPTADLNRQAWLSQLLTSMLLDGTAYCGVMGDSYLPLDAQTVVPRRINGRKEFFIQGALAPFEVIEIPCMMLAGQEKGLSPIEFARQSIGLGLAAQTFGAEFFAGEGNMPGVIEIPKPTQAGLMTEMAELWQRKRRKGGKGLPGVLQDGAQWKPTGVTNEQAQFLATRQYTAAEIVGQLFLIDPSELGIPVQGTGLTYANLAQRNTRRITFTCMPYIRRIETAFGPYASGFRFNVDARLRGDTKTSYETLAIALQAGFMTVDEVREILGMPKMPQGSSILSPAQAKAQLHAMLVGQKTQPVPAAVPAAQPARGEPDVHVHVTSPDIHLAPVWTVKPPDIRVEVAAPEVHVDAPVINVEPAPIPKAPPAKKIVRTVERDDDGKILRVVEV